MYWKTLPQAERDEWEAKAVVAQAEHRQRYPDWRFRPATTTVAKLKSKDASVRSRRRRVQGTTDPPDGGGGESVVSARDGQDVKGKGRDKSAGRGRGRGRGRSKIGTAERGKGEKKNDTERSREDQRLSKITDLLVEGKKGVELEIAVQEWERGRKVTRLQDRGEKAGAHSRSGWTDKSPPYSVTVFSSEPSTSSLPLPSEPPSTSTSAGASPVVQSLSNTASPLSWPATPITGHLDRPSLFRAAIDPTSYTRHYDSRRSSRSRSPSHFQRRTCSPSPTVEDDSRSGSPVLQAAAFSHRDDEEDSRQPMPLECRSPSDTIPNLSLVPLTRLYRRSLSAPAPHHRLGNPKTSTIVPPSPLIHQGGLSESVPAVKARCGSASSGLDQPETSSVVSPLLQFPQTSRNPFVLTPQYYPPNPPAAHHGHARRGTVSLPLVPNHYQHPYYNPNSLRHHRHNLSTHYEDPQQSSEQRRYEAIRMPTSGSVPWQEVEDCRRLELQKGAHSWWADGSVAGVNREYGDDYEPVRDGSFDLLQDPEENLGYPPEQWNRDVCRSRSWSFSNPLLIFLLQNLASTTAADPPPMNDGSHVVSWSDMPGRRGLVSINLSLDVDTPSLAEQLNTPGPFTSNVIEHHPSPSGLALPVSQPPPPPPPASFPSHVTTPSEGFFFPATLEQMSPVTPLSSFSSLAGWDGEVMSHADVGYSLAPDVVAASEEGGGRSQVPAGAQWPSLAWGHVQPLGLQGGGGRHWRGGEVEGVASWSDGDDTLERP